ncbi:MAG: SEC-C metal-binding domain-containing protein [Thermoanaerobaculia bacterium]
MAKRVDRFSQTVLGIFTRIFGSRLQRQVATSRSAPCPCGSGLKYKRCCLPKEIAKARTRRPPVAKKST